MRVEPYSSRIHLLQRIYVPYLAIPHSISPGVLDVRRRYLYILNTPNQSSILHTQLSTCPMILNFAHLYGFRWTSRVAHSTLGIHVGQPLSERVLIRRSHRRILSPSRARRAGLGLSETGARPRIHRIDIMSPSSGLDVLFVPFPTSAES